MPETVLPAWKVGGRLNYSKTVTIANGEQVSTPVNLAGFTLVGVLMPASFSGTAITFLAAEALGGTYRAMAKAGSDISITTAQGKYTPVDPSDFIGVQFLELKSGTSEGADREITLALREL